MPNVVMTTRPIGCSDLLLRCQGGDLSRISRSALEEKHRAGQKRGILPARLDWAVRSSERNARGYSRPFSGLAGGNMPLAAARFELQGHPDQTWATGWHWTRNPQTPPSWDGQGLSLLQLPDPLTAGVLPDSMLDSAEVTPRTNADQDKQGVLEWHHQLVDEGDPGQGSRDQKELDPASEEREGEQHRGNQGKLKGIPGMLEWCLTLSGERAGLLSSLPLNPPHRGFAQ